MTDIRCAFRVARIGALCLLALSAPAALAQDGRPAAAVTVVTIAEQDITLTATLPGRVIASGVAEVRPQVAGIITERLFDEGSEVEAGDPLYLIDAASYEAQVAAAKAAVAQAQAALKAAQREVDRVQPLVAKGVTSQQTADDTISTRDAAAAALQVAEAQLLTAEIELDRTTIRAPLSGIIGRSLTTSGSLVTAGQTGALAVIRQLDPVYVDVTQSAAELIAWRRGHTEQGLGEADRRVTLKLADGSTYEHQGELTAAEPYVDELTGVVVLRLAFLNPEGLLLPGMYVQVEMPQGMARNVMMVPQEGVMRNRRGLPIAYVVNDQNVVEQRDLTVLRDRGNTWIVSDGLKPGDKVIVEGLQKVAPGATVVPQERGASTPAQPAPAGKPQN